MEQDNIVEQVSSKQVEYNHQRISRCKYGLLSLIVLVSVFVGIHNWLAHLKQYQNKNSIDSWDHYQLKRVLQLSNQFSFQQSVLKYKFYLILACGYVQPNILLALCILLTFFVLFSIERQTATTVTFFEYNGISIYMQVLRLGLDLFQYLLTGRCYCLNSGAAAVWINICTKYSYHRLPQLFNQPFKALALLLFYIASAAMIVTKGRVDLLISVLIAIIELVWMGGGTIKFPKSVYQQKEDWASKIRVNRWSIWIPFKWNQFQHNQLMCVDNDQFYMRKEERIARFQR